jgi:hypothetical protein
MTVFTFTRPRRLERAAEIWQLYPEQYRLVKRRGRMLVEQIPGQTGYDKDEWHEVEGDLLDIAEKTLPFVDWDAGTIGRRG